MTKNPNTLARALRDFFSKYVPELRGLSRHTLLSYRDTLILLLRFVAATRNTDPVTLELDAISSEAVLDFPDVSGEGTSQQDLLTQRSPGRDPFLLSLRGKSHAGEHRPGTARFRYSL